MKQQIKKKRKLNPIGKMFLTIVIFVIIGSLLASIGSMLTLILMLILALITSFFMLKYLMELIKANKAEQEAQDMLRFVTGAMIGMGMLALYINLFNFKPGIYGGILLFVIGFIFFVILEF